MKKVALLSYHFWYNYGTCFQAYALQQVLSKLGHDPEYLNFGWRYPINTDVYLAKFWLYTKPKTSFLYDVHFFIRRYESAIIRCNLFETIYIDHINYKNNKRFDSFHESFIKESKAISVDDMSTIENYYDYFIVGSDQVWNPDCSETKYFTRFLLDFVEERKKKISYASSIGKADVDKKTSELYKKHLSSFFKLSCRERRGCELLQSITKRDAELVLDPTLLLTKDDWLKIAKPLKNNRNYLLCYLLGDNTSIVDYAQGVAQIKGLELKIVTTSTPVIRKYKKSICIGVGPQEFLGLIDGCEFLITDSFHGTAFAINFNKQFYSFFKHKGDATASDNSRIVDVLEMFGLKERFRSPEMQIADDQINFKNANLALQEMRKSSIDFLHRAII